MSTSSCITCRAPVSLTFKRLPHKHNCARNIQIRHLYLAQSITPRQIALHLGAPYASIYRSIKVLGLTRAPSVVQAGRIGHFTVKVSRKDGPMVMPEPTPYPTAVIVPIVKVHES